MAYVVNARQCRDFSLVTQREWLLTNGIGGYAMGTVSGLLTRRYHGHLVAATNGSLDRRLLLAGIEASVLGDGEMFWISSNQYPGKVFPEGYLHLERFTVGSAASWRYRSEGARIEKRLALHPGANACTVEYANIGRTSLELGLRPLLADRSYHGNFAETAAYPGNIDFRDDVTVIGHGDDGVFIRHPGARRDPVQGWYYRFEHAREAERGLDPRDDFYCPCELVYELAPGETARLCASLRDGADAVNIGAESDEAENEPLKSLQSAARHFIVELADRPTIVAGYPWFTDWGRDTMVALPGVCLHTGRTAEARRILGGYADAMFQGLIPNRFIEDGGADYNTADATLWFANAAYKTLQAEWDGEFATRMFGALNEAWEWHERGTLFGIRMDPLDGLLAQGERGLQLTWMDAKVGDWVVSPRHGKPVEIAGLWVNFLRILEWLSDKLGKPSDGFKDSAERAEASFRQKFWVESRNHYFDTVDPHDASLRPNQLVAMALPFGPASGKHAELALATIERELLTPYGIRTLGPQEPGYRGRFEGTLHELDAAYHQGTVWPWLLGPYASAVVKVTGDRDRARKALGSAMGMLQECGFGGIAEVYDGDEPHRPNGCPWQAWSVAEILRSWAEDIECP